MYYFRDSFSQKAKIFVKIRFKGIAFFFDNAIIDNINN